MFYFSSEVKMEGPKEKWWVQRKGAKYFCPGIRVSRESK